MKVTHLIMAFETGGSETMLVDIMNRQVENLDVSLIVINDIYNRELLSKIDVRVKIFCLNRKPSSYNIFKLLKLNYFLFYLKTDVVHLHNPAILKTLFFLKKKVLTMHDVLIRSLKKDQYFVKKIEKFDAVCAISNCVKNDIILNGFGRPENVIVVDNGIDITKIKNYNPDKNSNKFKIIQVSRLEHDKKGQHILLRAVRELIFEKRIENISVDFIGTGHSENYLKKLAKELQIEKFVNFLGFRNRDYIYERLCNYDLFVQPSLFEGFGLTVAEAMAAKIPVLVSNTDGPMEIIGNGDYGYSFEIGNYVDCSKQIIDIMRKPKETRLKMTELAFSRVIDKYSIKTTVNNYYNIYKN